jgi:hypothetical protein
MWLATVELYGCSPEERKYLIFVKAESSNRNDINTRYRKVSRKFLELTKGQTQHGDHNRGQRCTEEEHNIIGAAISTVRGPASLDREKKQTLICCVITAQNE